jgi:membrane protease YdiL (CAAX protease family)
MECIVVAGIADIANKILAGEYLQILIYVRCDMIIWGLSACITVFWISMTKYIADLPQKSLEGARNIKQALKVNKIRDALSSTEFDWFKLFRNIIICLVFMMLLSVPEMLLWGAPVINWTAWFIIACHQVVFLLVQTGNEEIMFRRGLVEQENAIVDKLLILVVSTVFFALGHLNNPEFVILSSNPYAVFAMLGLSSYGQVLRCWAEFFGDKLFMLVPIFICELFARPRYYVDSVCGYVSYGDIVSQTEVKKKIRGSRSWHV